MNKKILFIYSGIFFCLSGFSQNVIYKQVENARAANASFERIDILKINRKYINSGDSFLDRTKAYHLDYDSSSLNEIEETLSFNFNFEDLVIIIDLIEAPEEFYDYSVVTNTGIRSFADKSRARHYRGIVRGHEESLVSISFFENNISGYIYYENKALTILKERDSDDFILHRNSDNRASAADNTDLAVENRSFSKEGFCSDYNLDKNFTEYTRNELFRRNAELPMVSEKCVELYFETEYDYFEKIGNVEGIEDYVTALFNHVSTIYMNEGINIRISEIKVWVEVDPYTGRYTSDLLTEFQENTDSFNGHLGQLLTSRFIGGGKAAGIGRALCSSDVNSKLSVSPAGDTFSVNTFSNNILVSAHEFGHLFGSFHTHRCSWNGERTPIDNCGSYFINTAGCIIRGGVDNCNKYRRRIPGGLLRGEGSRCLDIDNPIIPLSGGTIMSSCNLLDEFYDVNYGVNFSLGFGPQPGNIIRSRLDQADCITKCNNCVSDLNIGTNVSMNQIDIQEANNTITATNVIFSDAKAEYNAGESVILKPGFNASRGSSFKAFIDGCDNVSNSIIAAKQFQENSEIEIENLVREEININIYPNPTSRYINISSKKIISSWELMNLNGKLLNSNNSETKIDLKNLESNLYILKVIFNDGSFSINKVIKR